MKYALVLNPTARSGRGRKLWDVIFQELRRARVEFVHAISEYPGHAATLANQFGRSGADVVVAVGGDGTINEVLSGVMECRLSGAAKPAMGIVYTGTSPDVCRYHGIPTDPEQAVACLLRGRTSLIDVGQVRFFANNKDDNSFHSRIAEQRESLKTSYFLCSVNLGVGAAVAEGSNSGLRRYLGDFLGTLCSIFFSLLRFRPTTYECLIDGKNKRFVRTFNMTIGKNPHIASGLKVDVPVEPDDGKLYLFSVNHFSLWELFRNLRRFYKGDFQEHPNNTLLYLKEFVCNYSGLEPRVEFDGDPRGFLPCWVTLLEKQLQLVK